MRANMVAVVSVAVILTLSSDELLAAPQCESNELEQLLASDGARGSRFGSSVSLDGDTALIGAEYDPVDPVDIEIGPGSAYIFRYDGTRWVEMQKLTASDGADDDRFGHAVSLEGCWCLIGAHADEIGTSRRQGSAYVFRYDGTQWIEAQKLTASDGTADAGFGYSVALYGAVALVGTRRGVVAGVEQGAAYVFRFDGTRWVEQQKLTASDGAAWDGFGWSVSLSGSLALIGAPGDDVASAINQGSAYAFRYDGTGWVEVRKLTASDGKADDFFGDSVSLNDGVALVGRPGTWPGTDPGAAYVFREKGSQWVEEHTLLASDGEVGDMFGSSVATRGDLALVGALLDDCPSWDQGSAYLFRYDGRGWAQQQKLIASDGGPTDDMFGNSVALSRDLALVGAAADWTGDAHERGAAYVFAAYPDLALTADPGLVFPGDLLTLETRWGESGDPVALAAIEVNGTEVFQVVLLGRFGAHRKWLASAVVPPGLTGIEATFRSYGITICGSIDESNKVSVTFR
ncbi:MAG: FG-GAP repeat protein [Planctomycetota bacterium]